MKTNKTSTLKMEQFENISQISKDVQDQDIVNIKDLDKDRKNEKDQKLKKTFGQYFLVMFIIIYYFRKTINGLM